MSEALLTVRCTQSQYDTWSAAAGHRALSRWVREALDTQAQAAMTPEPEPEPPANRCYHGLTDCALCDY